MKPLYFVTLLAAPVSLFAADASQTIIDRAQQTRAPSAPAKTASGIEVSPGDADAGNQRVAEKRKLPFKFTGSYDTQLYYTDNVELASPGTPKKDAYIFAQTLALQAEFNSFAIGKDGMIIPSVGFVYQRFYNGIGEGKEFSSLDFDSYSVPLNLRYRFGNNWEASLSLTANSVYSNDPATNYHQILRTYSPAIGLRKIFIISDKQILTCSTSASYSATKADVSEIPALLSYRDDRNDKYDYSADLGYYYTPGQWIIGPTARLGYSDYLHYQESGFTNVDRRDLTASFGLSASYKFKPWATVRIFSGYDMRKPQGANNGYEYTSKTLGLGLTLSAEF